MERLSYLFKYRLLQLIIVEKPEVPDVVIPVQIQASTTSRDSFNTHFLKLSYLFKYRLLQPPTVVAGYGQYELSYLFKYRLLQPDHYYSQGEASIVVIPVQIQASTTKDGYTSSFPEKVVIPVQIQASTTY